ncbi:sortase [Patescibacteria group bacterium]|nr:sortase [Patescibacteria group bacterium]MBU1472545.1 sortase [Patescibacteria group bacterium]MBU2460081.1 sortase [Patescibacteria group bacterium]MBU2544650.1 sortase [Patescibacteria group bacterium]
MQKHRVIYRYRSTAPRIKSGLNSTIRNVGVVLVALALGGVAGPFVPEVRMEASFLYNRVSASVHQRLKPATTAALPKSVPVIFNPLVTKTGALIEPVNTEFALVVPKIGINAPVIPAVNPAKPGDYMEALSGGIAHASTSFFPNENGTVYLFSHSTNYEWFVKDLNAVFYLLKNLDEGDLIVLFYKGNRYTYRLREKRVVGPKDVAYLSPISGEKRLILQTCWPPGSVSQRLLIFADLVEEQSQTI